MSGRTLHLFEGYGVELEYMIVDRRTLSVLPLTDRVLQAAGNGDPNEALVNGLGWSNELVLHVLEMKTPGPAASLQGLAATFQEGIGEARRLLEPLGGRLMPSAMHPWMDPLRETHLWPHGNREIFEAFDRVFGCQGHGWSNLQSVHINLPFHGDDEFGRLHAAIRLLLPIMPALAASSPVVEGRPTGLLDNRLDVYRFNCALVPSITGRVIPEPVFTAADYRSRILERIYADIALLDPEGILHFEWLNSRGAIARFERDTIEVRVLDIQECPRADLAILTAIVAALRALVEERWASYADQQTWDVPPLERIFLETVGKGEQALIEDTAYLGLFGLNGGPRTAGELWRHLVEALVHDPEAERPLEVLLRHGTLSRRILRALDGDFSPERLQDVYSRLCACLDEGELFIPGE